MLLTTSLLLLFFFKKKRKKKRRKVVIDEDTIMCLLYKDLNISTHTHTHIYIYIYIYIYDGGAYLFFFPPLRSPTLSIEREREKARRREKKKRVMYYIMRKSVNDPSAGSPTETLLRLLLPLNNKIYCSSRTFTDSTPRRTLICKNPIRTFHLIIQSVGATGGVYKGQGRNQRNLMNCTY